MRDKGTVIFWGVVLLIGLGVGSFFGIRAIVRANKVAPFKPNIDSYVALAIPAGTPSPKGPPSAQGKVKGRMITVDQDKREINYVYFDLPDELRAEKPEDVATVVLIRWSTEVVGQYSGGGPAERQLANVTVVNLADKQVVAQQQFKGGDPPQSKKRSQSGMGSKPDTQVVDFLKALPRS